MAADDSPIVAERALDPPERDRLFREWILPHLKLTDDHREFVESHLFIPGAKDFHSFPGLVSIPLDEHAPVERLKKLVCCTVSATNELELTGPVGGALLIPVTDPHGRLSAFRLLENHQIDAIKAGAAPGPVRWWYAASKSQPMLPNGDDPLHAVRYPDSDTVVVIRGIARASAVAAHWKRSGISTIKPTFPVQIAFEYIRDLCGKNVEVFIQREPTTKEAVDSWELADKLSREDLEVRMLVPVLSDLDFPKHYEECSALTVDTWKKGLPKELQQEIERKKRSSFDPAVAKTSKELSPEEVHGKLVAAYREMMSEGRMASVGGLSELAGVHWELALEWLKERGIDNTQVLQVKIERGWIPDSGSSIKRKRRIDPEKLQTPSLFDIPDDESGEPSESQENVDDQEPDDSHEEPAESDNLPAPSDAEYSPDKPRKEETVNQEGTLELVVEAQESIFEGETPLTQTMHGPDAPTMDDTSTFPQLADNHVKLGIAVIAGFLLLAAVSLIIQFGLNDDSHIDELDLSDNRPYALADGPQDLKPRLMRDYRNTNGNIQNLINELTHKIVKAEYDE